MAEVAARLAPRQSSSSGSWRRARPGPRRRSPSASGSSVIDADELLERELGEPIASFFEREGEAEFRRREERLVVSALHALAGQVGGASSVVALGGGAIESEAVRRALREHLPVWCDVDEETAWERAQGSGRPLAVDREEFSRRFADAPAALREGRPGDPARARRARPAGRGGALARRDARGARRCG